MKNTLDPVGIGEVFDALSDEDVLGFNNEMIKKLSLVVSKFGDTHRAIVKTAISLNSDEKKKIEGFLKKISKHSIKINFRVEPTIIGGIKITFGDWNIDGTLTHQIEALKQYMLAA